MGKMRLQRTRSYCCVYGCLNNSKDATLTFFSLPRDGERLRTWLRNIDREDLLQKDERQRKNLVVCSDHFDDSSIKIIKHLRPDVLPSKFLPERPKDGSEQSNQAACESDKKCVTTGTQTERKTKEKTSVQTGEGKLVTLPNHEEDSIEIKTEPLSSSEEETDGTGKSKVVAMPKYLEDIHVTIIKTESLSPAEEETENTGEGTGKVVALPNHLKDVTIEIKTEPLHLTEEELNMSKSNTGGKSRKRKLSD